MKEFNIDLVKYRLREAKEKLKVAELNFKNGFYKDSLSRSYYAIYNATKALLATKRLNSKKHSGIISLFNKEFVKTSIIDKKFSQILMDAKEYRERSDYQEFFIVSKEEALQQLENAEIFVKEIESLINKIIENT